MKIQITIYNNGHELSVTTKLQEFKACFVSNTHKASFELLFHINSHDCAVTNEA
ncbi:MAG: hypothetical protein GY749_10030 [Desulfobacteraceae bacterium]|nr:hypothetical protein [Desulfobacteraceae bacterium]